MSETVDLRLIGKLLRDVQAEQRSLITRIDLLQGLILENVVTALLNRIAAAEALSETRFDALLQRLDQTERSIEERLARIEQLVTTLGEGFTPRPRG